MKKFKPTYEYKYTWEGKTRYIYKGTIKTQKFKDINLNKFISSNREKFAQTVDKVRKIGRYKALGREKEVKILRHSNEALKRAKRFLGNIDKRKYGKALQRFNKIKNPIKATRAYETYLNKELLKRITIDTGDITVHKPRVILDPETIKFQKKFYKFREITRKSLIQEHGGNNITRKKRENIDKFVNRIKPVDFSSLSKEQIEAIFDYIDKYKNKDIDFREEAFQARLSAITVNETLREIPKFFRLLKNYEL